MKARALAATAAAIAMAALSSGAGVTAAAKPANRHPKPTYKTIKPSISESFYLIGTHGFVIAGTLRDRHALAITVVPPTAGASA